MFFTAHVVSVVHMFYNKNVVYTISYVCVYLVRSVHKTIVLVVHVSYNKNVCISYAYKL